MDLEKRWTTGVSVGMITAVFAVAVWLMLTDSLAETGGTLGAPLDDAWIHYQFARNIAQGNGFSFNPGDPTPGSTAPLWTILLAPIGWFTDDFLLPSLWISGGFLWLTGLTAFGFARWLSDKWWVGLLAGLATVTNGRLLWAGLAGMETTAFAFLSLLAIWRVSQKRLDWLAALLFGLATQLRPEGHALFGLAGLVALYSVFSRQNSVKNTPNTEHQIPNTEYVRLLIPLAVYLLISLPYVIFSLATTGNPLPNTFYAKVGSEHFFSWRTLRETAVIHWQDSPVALLLAAVGMLGAWRRSPLLVGWTVGLPLFTAVVIDQTWHHGRYTMPLIPLVMVLAAVGVSVCSIQYSVFSKRLAKHRTPNTEYQILFTGMLAVALVGSSLWTIPRWGEMHGLNAREILEIDVALGEWLAENTPPDALLAVQDIGAITFLSQREIIDLNGLVSPETWPALNERGSLARNQQLTRLLSERQPDYLVGFPLWNWEIAINEQVATAVHSVRTETKTIIFQQDAFVYETCWPYVAEAAGAERADVQFGDAIRLAEYTVAAEDALRLTLFWESMGVEPVAYDLFVHVLDEAGEIVVQADRQPVGGLAATNVWQPGDVVRDEVVIARPEGLANGRYTIALGFFNRETGERLSIDHPEAEGGRVELTAVEW